MDPKQRIIEIRKNFVIKIFIIIVRTFVRVFKPQGVSVVNRLRFVIMLVFMIVIMFVFVTLFARSFKKYFNGNEPAVFDKRGAEFVLLQKFLAVRADMQSYGRAPLRAIAPAHFIFHSAVANPAAGLRAVPV